MAHTFWQLSILINSFCNTVERKKKLNSCCTVTLCLPCNFDCTALIPCFTFTMLQHNVTPLPTQRMCTVMVACSSKHAYHEKTGRIDRTVVQSEQF